VGQLRGKEALREDQHKDFRYRIDKKFISEEINTDSIKRYVMQESRNTTADDQPTIVYS
jgi:hypothetical protein